MPMNPMVFSRGFTLLELMIAMGLGLFLVAGLLAVLTQWLQVDGHLLAQYRLRQDVQNTLAMMRNELGRSAYWGRAWLHPNSVNGFQRLSLPEPNCILYTYDHRGDDADGQPSLKDSSGFRLRQGVVQYRRRAPVCVGMDCGRCDTGRWSALTDPDAMVVHELNFSLLPIVAGSLSRDRQVHIEIRAGWVAGHDRDVIDLEAFVTLANG